MPDSSSIRAALRPTFARASRFWREDVFARGPAGTLQTALRMLRLAARWPAHRAWCRVVGGPTTRAILDVYPRIVYVHSFSYLFADTTWPQRLAMAGAHYAFLNRRHDAAFFERVIAAEGLKLWTCSRGGRDMTISLLGPCVVSRHHEGDLSLAFALDGTVLCKLAFSIVGSDAVPDAGPPGRPVVYIGQVQGTPGAHASIREAARLLHAVAARDLLMSAVAGLAQAWGIDTLLGVPGDQLLSHASWQNSSSRFDYTLFWQEHGARVGPHGHHVMRLPFVDKPLSAIAARHRGRTLAKRRFKQALSDDMAAALRSHLRPR